MNKFLRLSIFNDRRRMFNLATYGVIGRLIDLTHNIGYMTSRDLQKQPLRNTMKELENEFTVKNI